MRHPTDDELNDHHDGLLPEAERADILAHLDVCTACEDRAAALAELLGQLHGVPREITPPDHVWAAVQTAIAGEPAAVRSSLSPPRRRPDRRWLLAAAAVLLVVVSSSLTMLITRGEDAPSGEELVAQRIASEESLARFAELEAAYLRAAADLVDALERERRAIPPDVAARAEQSLLVIDAAVRETRAALADDPDNPALAALTLAAHRRKLDFLQQVRQWSTES